VPVKRSQNAGRTLRVFELVARLQPIGVSAIARESGEPKSAVQRDLVTLADAGWIAPAPGPRGQWELTLHMLSLARPPHSGDSLRHRMRPILEALHAETQETVYLTLPHRDRFVVFDALESRHVLRIVPPIGMPIRVGGSATGKAFLPYLSRDRNPRHRHASGRRDRRRRPRRATGAGSLARYRREARCGDAARRGIMGKQGSRSRLSDRHQGRRGYGPDDPAIMGRRARPPATRAGVAGVRRGDRGPADPVPAR
jgi:DNA-binding IclR family transcriptional regulator